MRTRSIWGYLVGFLIVAVGLLGFVVIKNHANRLIASYQGKSGFVGSWKINGGVLCGCRSGKPSETLRRKNDKKLAARRSRRALDLQDFVDRLDDFVGCLFHHVMADVFQAACMSLRE